MLVAVMLNSMFVHGHTPTILLKSVLCNIPKDLKGDLCNSNNYRGIALCSALCKAVDILMIERYEHILFTSGMQFAYKRHHSTNMCTTMIKEIASYYNSRHTDVFLCTLDASKAFDRVHLGKLFALLHNRGLPPVANRLLLDMYTRQRMCTTWNGVKSEFFSTENGVKQGGILSPILFCVYIDELLNRLLSSGIGCHMGHLSYACFGYADDVNLLAPSVGALQDLITICENFAKEYHVIFNEKKCFCMRIGGMERHRVDLSQWMVNLFYGKVKYGT